MEEQLNLLPGKTIKSGKRKKTDKKEEKLQVFIAKYIRLRYPGVVFNSDIASGMKLPIWIASKARQMRSERAQPDLIILEPKGPYHFLAIELKNEVSDVYLKDGVTISNCKSNKHILEQADMLKRLRDKGAWADFGFGRDHCVKIIDEYMSL